MSNASIDWSAFHRSALSRPPRELLRRTLGSFEIDQVAPGVAADLGCGSGADAAELLRRGWTVHAVDTAANGLAMLRSTIPPAVDERLVTHAQRFEAFRFPACDLVWCGYSLPFCAPEEWPALWRRILAALRPGDVMVFSELDARALFAGMELEAFDVEDGLRPSGGAMTRHAFGFAARKPTV